MLLALAGSIKININTWVSLFLFESEQQFHTNTVRLQAMIIQSRVYARICTYVQL